MIEIKKEVPISNRQARANELRKNFWYWTAGVWTARQLSNRQAINVLGRLEK